MHALSQKPWGGHAGKPGSLNSRSIAPNSGANIFGVNPTGRQGVKIAVGDDGMVSLEMTDVSGKESIGLLSDPDGKPSVCLAYRSVCRVVIGDVYRKNQRELSVQLRNNVGNSIWMPATANPIVAAAPGNSSK